MGSDCISSWSLLIFSTLHRDMIWVIFDWHNYYRYWCYWPLMAVTLAVVEFVAPSESVTVNLQIWAAAWQNQQNDMHPAKTQISLGIRPVWSESSLSAWRKLGSLATHWAHSEESDQTERLLGTPSFCWFCHEAPQLCQQKNWAGAR